MIFCIIEMSSTLRSTRLENPAHYHFATIPVKSISHWAAEFTRDFPWPRCRYGEDPTIGSLSLGHHRAFILRNNEDKAVKHRC